MEGAAVAQSEGDKAAVLLAEGQEALRQGQVHKPVDGAGTLAKERPHGRSTATSSRA